MNRATKEDVMRFARAVWPSAPNLALASFDEKKALNDAADRIAELEEFIKVLLPSWPDGEHYPTEMSLLQMKQERIAELEKFVSEFLFYFSSSNGIPVERATIKADSDIVRIARSL